MFNTTLFGTIQQANNLNECVQFSCCYIYVYIYSKLCTGDAIRRKYVPHPRAVTLSLPLRKHIANIINTDAQLLPLSGDEAILIMIMHLLDLPFYCRYIL